MEGSPVKVNKKRQEMHETPPEAPFLTVDEAHAIVGKALISRRSFYNAVGRRQIPSTRLGKRILIPRHAFTRWIETAGIVAAAE